MSKIAGIYCRVVVVDECEFSRMAVARLLRGPLRFASVTELSALDPVLRSKPDGSVDVVVFSLDPAIPAELRVEDVKRCYPDARRILIASERDPEAIKARLFAGVDGYVPLQLPASEFRSALRDALSKRGSGTAASARRQPLPQSGSADQGPEQFTPRERQIVMHLTKGRTSREIGRELDLPPGTVRRSLHEIYRRAGVRHRIDMMRAVLNSGELVAEPALLRRAGGTF